MLICQTNFFSAEKYFAITEGVINICSKNLECYRKAFFWKKGKKKKRQRVDDLSQRVDDQQCNDLPTSANLLLEELQTKATGAGSQCWPACSQLLKVCFQRVELTLSEVPILALEMGQLCFGKSAPRSWGRSPGCATWELYDAGRTPEPLWKSLSKNRKSNLHLTRLLLGLMRQSYESTFPSVK